MAEPRRDARKPIEGVAGAHVVIVEARFYEDIADALLAGAMRELEAAGVSVRRITVPGALEIPGVVAMAWNAARAGGPPCDAAVALGCVLRGDTIHFEIVSEQSARALMDLSIDPGIPLGNGILTVDTDAQAWARARMDEADKGGDAARAALVMLALRHSLAGAR